MNYFQKSQIKQNHILLVRTMVLLGCEYKIGKRCLKVISQIRTKQLQIASLFIMSELLIR